jgi:hypothetical protein
VIEYRTDEEPALAILVVEMDNHKDHLSGEHTSPHGNDNHRRREALIQTPEKSRLSIDSFAHDRGRWQVTIVYAVL